MNTYNTDAIKKQIELFGTIIHDVNLNRIVKELKAYTHEIPDTYFETIRQEKINIKYKIELTEITQWYNEMFPRFSRIEHRRQIVYFNNTDYIHRFQCISLIQIIDELMIIYQRSGDICKMKDDHRFFIEIRDRFFPVVQHLTIIYGSIHFEI